MNPKIVQLKIKLAQWLKKAVREQKSCGKCAVCHHVCSLLDKPKKTAPMRED